MNGLSNPTFNGHGANPYLKPSTRLRQLLAQDGCVQAPGVYDGISARLAIEAGFQVMVSCRPQCLLGVLSIRSTNPVQ